MNAGTEPTVPPAATAAEVLTAAERLAGLLAAANAALQDGPGEEVGALIGAIAPAARNYEIGLRTLDPAAVTAGLRQRLRQAGERLQTAAAEHERRLHARVVAQRRLIACVGEAVAAATGAGTYSRRGTLSSERPGRLTPPAATLSRAL